MHAGNCYIVLRFTQWFEMKLTLLFGCTWTSGGFCFNRSTYIIRVPWVDWTKATRCPYHCSEWNVEPMPHLPLAHSTPWSGNCPSILSKISHTLTLHISMKLLLQGESRQNLKVQCIMNSTFSRRDYKWYA
jgi:hypothetical protein